MRHPATEILHQPDLIRLGGLYLRLSAICYAIEGDDGVFLYLNHGRVHLSSSDGGKELLDWLNANSSSLLRAED